MSSETPQLLDDQSANGRAGVIRLARYSVFPRVASDQGVQIGFTREAASNRRVTLVARAPEAVGELLRVQLQDVVQGSLQEMATPDANTALARVLSCRQRGVGGWELEIEALDTHRPRFARRARD